MKKRSAYVTLQNVAILVISVILLQTLPFKFLALPESVALFTKIHMEPWGRVSTGILELLGVIGLFTPLRKGAALGIALLMCGALYFHATVLGWNGLALSAAIVLLFSIYLLFVTKDGQR